METRISIEGLSGLDATIKAKVAQLKSEIASAIQGAGIDCQAEAKQLCPVDTGRLRSSIQYVKTDEMSCEVNTDVHYARFVEEGTSKQHPQPYLFPSFLKAKEGLMTELQALKV